MASVTSTASLIHPKQRAEQGLLRAIGQEVLRQLPPTEYAFSYGSSAMPQLDSKLGVAEELSSMLQSIDYRSGSKMFDLVLAVDNPPQWHDINQDHFHNKDHYSLFTNSATFRQVLYHDNDTTVYQPQIPFRIYDPQLLDAGVPEVINVKYGVTSMNNIITDCINWTQVYLAGRLHKPVTILQDNPHMNIARELNLHHAVAYALLQLPPQFTELELFTTIAKISYHGDIRHVFGAEDPQKVNNLVMGSLPFFRELYSGILTAYLSGAQTVQIDTPTSAAATASNVTLPLYDYLTIPPVLAESAAENKNKALPLLRNYHDVYQQIANVAPQHVIFSQPDTAQHKALLAASLPSNLYVHRTISTNAVSEQHKNAMDRANGKTPAAKRTGSDQDGLTAPSTSGSIAETPPSFIPPSPGTVEAKLAEPLPPCLTVLPYSVVGHSFSPQVLDAPFAKVSPLQDFDRNKQLLQDKVQLAKLLTAQTPTSPKTLTAVSGHEQQDALVSRLQTEAKALAQDVVQRSTGLPERATSTPLLEESHAAQNSEPSHGHHDEHAQQEKPTPKKSVQPATRRPTAAARSLDSDDESDEHTSKGSTAQAPSQPQPASFLKHSTKAPVLDNKPNMADAHAPSLTRSQTPSTTPLLQGSNPNSRAGRLQSIYTTTVSDIVSIERRLESPQQHNALLLAAAGNTQIGDVLATLNEPSVVSESLVLPTISPISVDQALIPSSRVRLLNAHDNASIRAIEIPVSAVASKSSQQQSQSSLVATSSKPFTLPSNYNSLSIKQSLPIRPIDQEYQSFKKTKESLEQKLSSEFINTRKDMFKETIRLQSEIKDLKKQIQVHDKPRATVPETPKDDAAGVDTLVVKTNMLQSISEKEKQLATTSEILADRTFAPITEATEVYVKRALPGLWNHIKSIDQYSPKTYQNKSKPVSKTIETKLALTSVGSLDKMSEIIDSGLIVERTPAFLQTGAKPIREYLAFVTNPTDFKAMMQLPDYSLKTVPNTLFDASSASQNVDTQLIVAHSSPTPTAGSLRKIDRQKILADPWHYDRIDIPSFYGSTSSSKEELDRLISDGALPELAVNRFSDRRQRWQVNSSLSREEQYNELALILDSIDAQGQNSNLREYYATLLQNAFINVKAASYDPRRHLGGVARFDNSVNALQVLLTSKFPIFGAYLMQYQQRNDFFPLWRHCLSAYGNHEQNNDQLPSLSPLVPPMTSLAALKHYQNDEEFLSQLQPSHQSSKQLKQQQHQIRMDKMKNFELVFVISQWEQLFATSNPANTADCTQEEVFKTIIANRLHNTVRNSSKRQTMQGVVTAGVSKSISYAFAKLKKGVLNPNKRSYSSRPRQFPTKPHRRQFASKPQCHRPARPSLPRALGK